MVLLKNLTLGVMNATFLDVFWNSQRKDTLSENSAFCALRLITSSITHICILILTVLEELQRYLLSIWGFIVFILAQTEKLKDLINTGMNIKPWNDHTNADRPTGRIGPDNIHNVSIDLVSHFQTNTTTWVYWGICAAYTSCPPIWPTEKRVHWWGWGGGEDVAYAPLWPLHSTGTAVDSSWSSSRCHVDTLYCILPCSQAAGSCSISLNANLHFSVQNEIWESIKTKHIHHTSFSFFYFSSSSFKG